MNLREFIDAIVESRTKYNWQVKGQDDDGLGKRFLRAYDEGERCLLEPINVVAKLRGHRINICDPVKVALRMGISEELALRITKASDYRGDETLQRLLVSAAMRGKRLGDK